MNWAERLRESGLPGPLAQAEYEAEVARARATVGSGGAGADAPPAELATILAWIERAGDPWAVVQPRVAAGGCS